MVPRKGGKRDSNYWLLLHEAWSPTDWATPWGIQVNTSLRLKGSFVHGLKGKNACANVHLSVCLFPIVGRLCFLWVKDLLNALNCYAKKKKKKGTLNFQFTSKLLGSLYQSCSSWTLSLMFHQTWGWVFYEVNLTVC